MRLRRGRRKERREKWIILLRQRKVREGVVNEYAYWATPTEILQSPYLRDCACDAFQKTYYSSSCCRFLLF